VAVIILTGADPAFCAGLDLKELAADGGPLGSTSQAPPPPTKPVSASNQRPMLPTSKPLIGAINGVAVTGGLELALNCDFLVASERARFADTHARMGVQPLWGLSVLLPEAVGLRRAREMSASGNFVDAATALAWGLVNHVVAHSELLDFVRRLAADIVTSDQRALQRLFATYRQGSLVTRAEAWEIEAQAAAHYQVGGVDVAEMERRRHAVMERGRSQT
jgi:enoyl-CoA hydratase